MINKEVASEANLGLGLASRQSHPCIPVVHSAWTWELAEKAEYRTSDLVS